MKTKATPTEMPPDTLIHQALANADFADCDILPDPHPELDALHTYLAVFARAPRWMHALMVKLIVPLMLTQVARTSRHQSHA